MPHNGRCRYQAAAEDHYLSTLLLPKKWCCFSSLDLECASVECCKQQILMSYKNCSHLNHAALATCWNMWFFISFYQPERKKGETGKHNNNQALEKIEAWHFWQVVTERDKSVTLKEKILPRYALYVARWGKADEESGTLFHCWSVTHRYCWKVQEQFIPVMCDEGS